MKLVNKNMAKQKLALSGGIVAEIDADGYVEVDDKSTCEVLLRSGFKSVSPVKEEPVIAVEPEIVAESEAKETTRPRFRRN